MKKYTSPAVTNSASVSFMSLAIGSPSIASSLFGTSEEDTPKPFRHQIPFQPQTTFETVITSAAKSLFNALFGEDFTGLQVDSLMPCLEA